MIDDIDELDEPELVQSLTEAQGIAIAIIGDSVEDSGEDFCQYYGDRRICEVFDDSQCSRDGILWGTSDFGAPLFCTTHSFPYEQTGYEFVPAELLYAARPHLAPEANH